MKLHELDAMFAELENDFESLDQADLTPELEQKILDLLEIREAVNNEYKNKINNYCKLIANLEAIAEVRQKEIDRLTRLVEIDNAKVDFLKARLKDSLKQNGIKKITTDNYNLSVKRNSIAPLEIDTDSIPSEYQRIKIEIDKKRLREAIANGVDVPGVSFGEKGDHLIIK